MYDDHLVSWLSTIMALANKLQIDLSVVKNWGEKKFKIHVKNCLRQIFLEYWQHKKTSGLVLVRDSSAVRRLLWTCCSRGTSESSTYGKQRMFPPTLGQHISTFRGYLILFSIRNLYINRFTNHLTLRKWCYTALQHDFPLDPMISSFHIHFGTFAT
jgi:hypothetical protein